MTTTAPMTTPIDLSIEPPNPPFDNVWRRAAIWFGAWTVLVVLFSGFNYLSRVANGVDAAWAPALVWSAAQWFAWALLTPFILRIGRHFRIQSSGALKPILVHLLVLPVFVLAQVLIERVLLQILLGLVDALPGTIASLTRTSPSPLVIRIQRGTGFGIFSFGVIVLAGHTLDYYRLFRSRELRAVRLEGELSSARLEALRAQLQPHFLFNTLNSIAGLLHTDAHAADRMLMNLSDLLRRMLEGEADSTIADELAFIDAYLEIESERLGNRLVVRRGIDPRALDARVPSLLLQPLVENAVRHGVQTREQGGAIEIMVQRRDDTIEIRIWNDAGGPDAATRRGIGLSNTRARLASYYPEGYALTVEEVDSQRGGFLVAMTLPLRLSRPRRALRNAPPAAPRSGQA